MNRFRVHYKLTLSPDESVQERLDKICREQSAELPMGVVEKIGMLHVLGEITGFSENPDGSWSAQIDWPHQILDDDPSQLLNVLFGNISLMPGIQITGLDWETLPSDALQGPRFGIPGIRRDFQIPERALSCTALKPTGFSSGKLAGLCYRFARGGIDIIKDDHGLANQETAPFEQRVRACLKAVQRAADETGKKSHYFPNISANGEETLRRIEFAARNGCSGVLISPHLSGLSLLPELTRYNIPLMVHPAFSGQLVINESHGFTVPFLYGSLWRAFGADFVIYPNAGGRFSFSEQTCRDLNSEARAPSKAGYPPAWPTPGGGIQRDTIAGWLQSYGNDTVFLAGGSLYQHPDGIEQAAIEFSHSIQN